MSNYDGERTHSSHRLLLLELRRGRSWADQAPGARIHSGGGGGGHQVSLFLSARMAAEMMNILAPSLRPTVICTPAFALQDASTNSNWDAHARCMIFIFICLCAPQDIDPKIDGESIPPESCFLIISGSWDIVYSSWHQPRRFTLSLILFWCTFWSCS